MSRLDVRDPVADRLARRLLERLRPELDWPHLGAEQAHPLDVRRLPAHVFGAHVDDAVEPEPRADGRGRDAVLSGARLGDDPALPEPPRGAGARGGVSFSRGWGRGPRAGGAAPRRDARDRRADLGGRAPARQNDPAPCCAGTLDVLRILLPPRAIDHPRDLLLAAKQDAVTRPMSVLARI